MGWSLSGRFLPVECSYTSTRGPYPKQLSQPNWFGSEQPPWFCFELWLIIFSVICSFAAATMIWRQLSSDLILILGSDMPHAHVYSGQQSQNVGFTRCDISVLVQVDCWHWATRSQKSRFTMGSLGDTFWNFQIGETCVVQLLSHTCSRDLPPFLHEDGGEKRPENADTLCAWDSQ